MRSSVHQGMVVRDLTHLTHSMGEQRGEKKFESDREYFHQNKTNLTYESYLDSEGSSHIRASTCDWHLTI